MSCTLVSVTKSRVADIDTAEELTTHIARVSNPANQFNKATGSKLLKYCYTKQHWSVFEHAYMTVKIVTTRAIARQILRHRSFTFQEFSQRYAEVHSFENIQPRRQDVTNRQSSHNDLDEVTKNWFNSVHSELTTRAASYYEQSLAKGISKESARFLLPESATSVIYMTGNIRSWITYLQLRTGNGTQLEHQEIAREIRQIFCTEFPVIGQALMETVCSVDSTASKPRASNLKAKNGKITRKPRKTSTSS